MPTPYEVELRVYRVHYRLGVPSYRLVATKAATVTSAEEMVRRRQEFCRDYTLARPLWEHGQYVAGSALAGC